MHTAIVSRFSTGERSLFFLGNYRLGWPQRKIPSDRRYQALEVMNLVLSIGGGIQACYPEADNDAVC